MTKPTNYEVVQLTPQTNGEWQMTSAWGNGNGHGTPYPRFKLDKDSGPHIISFQIAGGTPNVTFTEAPISVHVGSKPKQGDTNPQIAWAPGATNTQLWVVDFNTNPADAGTLALNYVLHVNNFKDLDPIIDNGGTTRPPPPPPPPPPTGEGQHGTTAPPPPPPEHQAGYNWSCLVIGLLIGLIIGLILCWWRRKSAERTTA